jgi:hypothetical protein
MSNVRWFRVEYFLALSVPFVLAANCRAADNLAANRPYTMDQKPDYNYCTGDSDITDLTDGKHISSWTEQGMVGWLYKKRATVTIDLGQVYPVGTIAVRCATGTYASVTFPKAALVFASVDGKDFYYLGNAMTEAANEGEGVAGMHRFLSPGFIGKGRYVKIIFVPAGAFIFCDEIEVLRGGHNVSDVSYHPSALESNLKLDELIGEQKSLARERNRLTYDLNTVVSRIEKLNKTKAEKFSKQAEDLRQRILEIKQAKEWDFPAGPPYTPLHREVFELHQKVASAMIPGQSFIIWKADPWLPIKPTDLPQAGVKMPEWDLRLLGNEYEPMAFNLTNLSAKDLTIHTQLIGLPVTVDIHESVFVEAAGQTMINDALPKRMKVVVPPGMTKQIWVNINTAKTEPGSHSGAVTVSVNDQKIKMPVELEVLPIQIAEKKHINTYSWAYMTWKILVGYEKEAYADLKAHYQNTFVIVWFNMPKVKLDDKGKLLPLDFTKLDKELELQPGADMYLLWLGFDFPNGLGFTNMLDHKNRSKTWAPQLKAYIRQIVQHLKEKGIGYDRFAFYLVDEPGDDLVGADAPFLDIVVGIKQMDANILTYIDYCPSTLQTIPIVGAGYDILCPQMSYESGLPGMLDAFRKTGKRLWSYECSGPGNKLYSATGYYRYQIWNAWHHKFSGAGFWAYADTANTSAWDDMDAHGDWAVVYESTTGPVSSRRWEAWREGVEDYEYFWLLRDRINRAKQAGQSGAAVTKAEKILANGSKQLVEVSKRAGNKAGAGEKDISNAMTKIRREVLEALVNLN